MAFCGSCGTTLSTASLAFCTNCGTPVGDAPKPSNQSNSIPERQSSPSEEQPLLTEAGIFVSKSRFVTGSQTYAMSGITSVRAIEEHPSRKGPILTIGFGLICIFFAFVLPNSKGTGFLLGLFLIGVGVAIFRSRKVTYSVILRSASGEQKATSSKDRALTARIVEALNQAIVLRG